MEKKHQVHNLIILDESGSMKYIEDTIIQGFNEVVQTIKGVEQKYPEQEHFISFISFNGLGGKVHHFIDPASKLNQLESRNYQPNASTPLFDAIGLSVNKLRQVLQEQTDYSVLVTILTDGEENASKEYSGRDIKELIDGLKQNRWTFTYIGTDHDVEKVASSLSIDNVLNFEKNEEDIKEMFFKERKARENYSKKIHLNEEIIANYFEDTE